MNPNINTINNFQQGENGEQISCKDRIKQAWSGVSFFVRFIMVTTVSLYILSWILPLEKNLSNIPKYTIKSFHIWRLISSVLMTASIFNIFFAFISWVPDAIRLENSSGTVRYCLNFFLNSFLIQVLYSVMMLLISIIFGEGALTLPSSGLWPLIMAEITILCLINPDQQVKMFFIPYSFRAKYYPWALFGFFTLLNFNLQFDILSGIFYGYIMYYYLRSILQISDNFIVKCENNFIFRSLSKFTGFVPIQATSNNFNSGNSFNNQGSSSDTRVERTNNQPVTTAFKGKGTVVGK
jgi:membrane associated rhomboid family serine protease